jgi:isopenicillin N synthase-like dioxygenase
MASDNFPDLPPFPNDIPTTPLLRLSLAKLLKHEEGEYQRFCTACEEIGFFYLDLRELEDGQSILSDADQLFKLSEDLFALAIEEKKKYDGVILRLQAAWGNHHQQEGATLTEMNFITYALIMIS